MFNVDLKQFKGSHKFEGSNQKIKGVNFPSSFLGFIINENQVYEISIADHGNVNEKERNKMVFEQIPDLERKNQGRSIHKIIDCCTKLGIDGSQVEKVVSVAIHNKNLHVLVTDMFKINRGISPSIMKGIFEPIFFNFLYCFIKHSISWHREYIFFRAKDLKPHSRKREFQNID